MNSKIGFRLERKLPRFDDRTPPHISHVGQPAVVKQLAACFRRSFRTILRQEGIFEGFMPYLLEVKELGKRFRTPEGEIEALSKLSLSVKEGAIFGIIGLSGAGKSTLIRCLTHLDIPTSGKIFFADEEVGAMGKERLRAYRKEVGMIFQQFNLLSSRDVFGNVSFPLEIAGVPEEGRRRRVEELLELVGLNAKGWAHPSQLSGGEKQRVGIARALANYPRMVLSDEATSSLDPKTTREILSLLKSLNHKLKLTILLITHEMDVVKQICSHVAVLGEGRVVESGPVADLFSDPKHPLTKSLLLQTHHELPSHILKAPSEGRKLLRLSFKGEQAKTPVISTMIRTFSVEANILMGWVDALAATIVGTLIIEISGESAKLQEALEYLKENTTHCEELCP